MSVPGGSQGGMQSKLESFMTFISQSQKARDRIKFEEISLENQKTKRLDGSS